MRPTSRIISATKSSVPYAAYQKSIIKFHWSSRREALRVIQNQYKAKLNSTDNIKVYTLQYEI
jgi:hypothetical protein